MLLPRNAVGRNRFSLAMSSQEVRPLSDDLTPSTVPLPVRKFTCATHAIWHPDIAHDRYRMSRSAGAIDLPVLPELPVASVRSSLISFRRRGPESPGLNQSLLALSSIASCSFLMSAGDNCGRSTLIVSLLSLAVSVNGG